MRWLFGLTCTWMRSRRSKTVRRPAGGTPTALLGDCSRSLKHQGPPVRLCAAPEGIGEDGQLLSDCSAGSSSSGCEEAATVTGSGQQAAPGSTETAGAAPAEPASLEGVEGPAAGSSSAPGAAADGVAAFLPASSFVGARHGYAFKLGEEGLGYYADDGGQAADAEDELQQQRSQEHRVPVAESDREADSALASPAALRGNAAAAADDSKRENCCPNSPEQPEQPPTCAGTAPGSSSGDPGGDSSSAPAPGPRHYWGQALQYLDRAVQVAPGRRLMLLARREGGKPRFALRQGVGEWVERAPWKVEWGGGASVENPHYQRVHYCELLVRPMCLLLAHMFHQRRYLLACAAGCPALCSCMKPWHAPPPPTALPAARRRRCGTSCSACAASASRPSRATCAWCWRTAAPCSWTPRRCRWERLGAGRVAGWLPQPCRGTRQLDLALLRLSTFGTCPHWHHCQAPCACAPSAGGVSRAGGTREDARRPRVLAGGFPGGGYPPPAAPALSACATAPPAPCPPPAAPVLKCLRLQWSDYRIAMWQ